MDDIILVWECGKDVTRAVVKKNKKSAETFGKPVSNVPLVMMGCYPLFIIRPPAVALVNLGPGSVWNQISGLGHCLSAVPYIVHHEQILRFL